MKPRFWHSLSFRLALGYAGTLCLSMVLLSGAYYWMAVVRPLDAVQAEVHREAQVLAQTYIVDGETALVAALERRRQQPSGRRAFHAFLAPDGRVVSANLPSWPARPAKGWFSIEADVYREGDEQDFSALSRDRTFRNGARLIVGRDAEDIEDRDEVVLAALPWVFGLTLLFGLVGGLFMSRTIGRRLDLISSAARQVLHGDLGGRVTVTGSGDDFDRLAATINAMLARNEELFEAVRRVSDNVAHELRTPLARLVTRLERLEAAAADLPACQPDLEAAMAEASRLQAIFNALLRIARIEGGRHEGNFARVDLAVLVADAAELYAPVAEARGIDLQVSASPATFAQCDRDLLFQAVSNLLDNALKFTPAGETVRLAVAQDQQQTRILVADSGSGLQPGEAGRITERFFRGKGAAGLPGDGLGLTLVSAIATLHGGHLTFQDGHPGLVAELILPGTDPHISST